MRLLRADERRETPWKNGDGVTSEIVASPGDASGDFNWRVSIATIASAGPFSLYPGVTRTLTVLDGQGVTLTGPIIGSRFLTPASDPLRFQGDEPIDAVPISGPTRDLNIITRNRSFDHELRVLPAGVTGVLAENGLCCVVAGDVAIECRHASGSVRLEPFDAVLFDHDTLLVDLPSEARAYAIHITPIAARLT